jgi:alpha/beta superfamily hydrolase
LRASTRREFVAGPAGRIECAVDPADGVPRGAALVAHPHPLYGGTLDNKVVQTLAKACVESGYEAWRPNFRGIGESEGRYDEGRGELEDLAAVADALGERPLLLAGFSFGGAMAARLAAQRKCQALVLVGPAVTAFELPAAPVPCLVIHGEADDTIPLAAVLDWARPQDLPVVVVPGADHFFHRRLNVIRDTVRRWLR